MPPARQNRDNFARPVVDALAKRVGQRCSNPLCRSATSGPAATADKATIVGVAAHITAAAPGGPRYDATMDPKERASAVNGIWLCQRCGRLVDVAVATYPTQTLQTWKIEAEKAASRAIAGALGAGSPVIALESVLDGHSNYVWDVLVTPDGRHAVSASNDGTARVWDLTTGLLRGVLRGHESHVCSVAIDRLGERIAAGAMDGSVRCWNLLTLGEFAVLPPSANDAKVAWLPDGGLAVGNSAGELRVWRESAGGWVLTLCQ